MRITTQPKTITLLCLIGWTTSWLALADMNRMEPDGAAIKCTCSPTPLSRCRLVPMLVYPLAASSLPSFEPSCGDQ